MHLLGFHCYPQESQNSAAATFFKSSNLSISNAFYHGIFKVFGFITSCSAISKSCCYLYYLNSKLYFSLCLIAGLDWIFNLLFSFVIKFDLWLLQKSFEFNFANFYCKIYIKNINKYKYILLKTFIINFVIFENRLIVRIYIRSSWRINNNANLIFIRNELIIVRSRIVCIIIGLLDCISGDLHALSVASNWIVSSLSNAIDNLRIVYFAASLTFTRLNRRLSLRLSILTSTAFLWNLIYVLTS